MVHMAQWHRLNLSLIDVGYGTVATALTGVRLVCGLNLIWLNA